MNRKSEGVCGLLLATVLLGAPALRAQETPPAPEFGASLDVRVVNVEAVVTDRRGNRVEGLEVGDFRLLVDGREVPVDYFTEVRRGETVAAVAPSSPDAAATAPAPPISPGGVGTSYLVFIDESFSVGADRDLALKRLEEDLRLGPNDRMAIVAYGKGRLDRLSDWTEDAAALRGALQSARERPANGIDALVKRRQTMVDARDYPGAETFPDFGVQDVAAAAAAAMRAAPPAEGRKVLFLISGGWTTLDPRLLPAGPTGPPRLSFDGVLGLKPALSQGSLADRDPISGRELANTHILLQRPADLFEVVTGTANLLGYTIYLLNGPSHEPSWADVEATSPEPHGLISTEYEMGVREASDFMTRETGGRMLVNSLRRSAFQQAAEDVRSYYWLGFSPEWRSDGRNHQIRLEVRRPGLRVRNRSGYADLTREARAVLANESLLLFGGGPETRTIAVQAGEPRPAGFGRIELPVTLAIPAEALTVSPIAGGYEARARLAVSNVDRWGSSSRFLDAPLRLTLPAPLRAGEVAHYQATLRVRKIDQKLTFAVQEETGGGSARGQLEYKPSAGPR